MFKNIYHLIGNGVSSFGKQTLSKYAQPEQFIQESPSYSEKAINLMPPEINEGQMTNNSTNFNEMGNSRQTFGMR